MGRARNGRLSEGEGQQFARHCERREAIQGQTLDHCRTCPWIASSLTLLPMTGPHSLSPQAGREDARRYRARRLCVLDDAAIERPRAWCGIFPQLCRELIEFIGNPREFLANPVD